MRGDEQPSVQIQMLFRVPVERAFEAFVDPAITTRFWFTHSDGRLEPGKCVRWEWRMFGVSTQVNVLAVEKNRRILIEWGDAEQRSNVEWIFTPRTPDTTLVDVTNSGFTGSPEEVIAQVIDSTGGFNLVLAGAKALLEHGIELNLIGDRFPAGHVVDH